MRTASRISDATITPPASHFDFRLSETCILKFLDYSIITLNSGPQSQKVRSHSEHTQSCHVSRCIGFPSTPSRPECAPLFHGPRLCPGPAAALFQRFPFAF